jgi:hypothetical protein
MIPVVAQKALFIKLGEGGRWAKDCLETGTLRFGYQDIPHAVCAANNLTTLWQAARAFRGSDAAASNDVTQIRHFYESDDSVLWITFHGDCLWWSFSSPDVYDLPGNEKCRRVIGQWHQCDINGSRLQKGGLSGKLLAIQGFMGTICKVSELNYLLHKINGTFEPHVAAAQMAYKAMQDSLVPIIKNLHQDDLETFVDLIFRQAGWQRVGVAGGRERDIDLDLISPVTQERIAVQVKSKASINVWRDYKMRYAEMGGFSKFYFVTHSPSRPVKDLAEAEYESNFILWNADQLAMQAVRAGLTGWLLDKAS